MVRISLPTIEQPESECGPAALWMVLRAYGLVISVDEIAAAASSPVKWRDWYYRLGTVALRKGFSATVQTLSTQILDPSWKRLSRAQLKRKLVLGRAFARKKASLPSAQQWRDPYLLVHPLAYELPEYDAALEFLAAGGAIAFEPLTTESIKQSLRRREPIIIGFNAPLLHGLPRSTGTRSDDLHGSDWEHVAVISGSNRRRLLIADTTRAYRRQDRYWIEADRLIEANLRQDLCTLMVGRPHAGQKKSISH